MILILKKALLKVFLTQLCKNLCKKIKYKSRNLKLIIKLKVNYN